MKQKTIIPIIAIAITAGVFSIALMEFAPPVATDTIGLTNYQPPFDPSNTWLNGVVATYSEKDPLLLRDMSSLVLEGIVLSKAENTRVTETRTTLAEGELGEPDIRTIEYNVGIKSIIKGQYDHETIDVVTMLKSDLVYNVGDVGLFILDYVGNEWYPMAGPYGMYKIYDENNVPVAHGHENKFDYQNISPEPENEESNEEGS